MKQVETQWVIYWKVVGRDPTVDTRADLHLASVGSDWAALGDSALGGRRVVAALGGAACGGGGSRHGR